MLILRFLVSIFSASMLILTTAQVFGQTVSTGSGQAYPNKTIRIVTGGITSSSGSAARLIAQGLIEGLGQPVIVENRGTSIGPEEIVSRASPDGYTLLVTGSSVWLVPLTRKVSYDPLRDFAPISLIGRAPQVLVVHPSLPVKSVKELIAYAKARPGELNFSTGGVGGSSHLAGALFNSLAGVNIVAIPYASRSQEITDLISGRVQMTFTSPASTMEQVKLGKLRALGGTSAEPSVLLSGIPVIAATLPNYESVLLVVIFAPAKTPTAIIRRLNQEVSRVLSQPDVKEKLLTAGIETVGGSPEQLAVTMKSETARWSKVIKEAGIRVEQ